MSTGLEGLDPVEKLKEWKKMIEAPLVLRRKKGMTIKVVVGIVIALVVLGLVIAIMMNNAESGNKIIDSINFFNRP